MNKDLFELYGIFFKTLSNETRFKIIRLLIKGPKSVNEISKKLKFEQSRVSHNLKKLECYGFVTLKSKGRQRIYHIDKKYVLPIINNVDKYIYKYDKRLKECLENNYKGV